MSDDISDLQALADRLIDVEDFLQGETSLLNRFNTKVNELEALISEIEQAQEEVEDGETDDEIED